MSNKQNTAKMANIVHNESEVRNEKRYASNLAISFLFFLAVFFVSNFLTADRDFSEFENRRLQQFPLATLQNIFFGSFTGDFESYTADQFMARDFWVSLKAGIEKLSGRKDNNGVYMGSGGQLMQMFPEVDETIVASRIGALNSFAALTSGITKYLMLVPNSVEMLKEKLPAHASPASQLVYINEIQAAASGEYIICDTYNILASSILNGGYIYYRTDHHWTTDAAYLAYSILAERMDFKPLPPSQYSIRDVPGFYGVLHSKCSLSFVKPDILRIYTSPGMGTSMGAETAMGAKSPAGALFNMERLEGKDKYAVFLDSNQPVMKIKTSSLSGEKLLVIKDSFANCLIPFLTDHFTEITVIDLRYYTESVASLSKTEGYDKILILYNVISFFEESSFERLAWD